MVVVGRRLESPEWFSWFLTSVHSCVQKAKVVN